MCSILANLVPWVLFPGFGGGAPCPPPKPGKSTQGTRLDPGIVNFYFYTLRGPNNYIKRLSPFFLRLASYDRPNFLALSKKKKRESLTFLTSINSFNLKDEHYHIISRHKRFSGISFLLWIDHHRFRHIEFVSIWWPCVAGAWKWWAQERTGRTRETRVSPHAHILYRAVLRSACYTKLYVSLFSSATTGNPRSNKRQKIAFMLTACLVLLSKFFWEFSIFHFCRPLVDICWHLKGWINPFLWFLVCRSILCIRAWEHYLMVNGWLLLLCSGYFNCNSDFPCHHGISNKKGTKFLLRN